MQLVRQLVRKGADVQHVFGRYGVRLSTARGVHARCNARNWQCGLIAGAKALQPVFLAAARPDGRSERRSVMLTTFLIIVACIAAGMLVNHVHPETRE